MTAEQKDDERDGTSTRGRDIGPHAFDPWKGRLPERSDRVSDPEAPPAGWYRLRPTTRERIGGEAVKLLAEEGRPESINRTAYALWDRVRTDRAAEQDLCRIEVGGPAPMLLSVLQKLTLAGDLVATIEARIASEEAQLTRLCHVRGQAPCQVQSTTESVA